MRRFSLTVALLATSAMICAAAEIDLPSSKPAEEISMQKGPPNCARWTDTCVNCTREASGEAAVCSNVGIACQPKPVRCTEAAIPPASSGLGK